MATPSPRLPDQAALLDAVVGHAPMLLFAFDADGRVTLRRGKAIETMGGKPDDHVGEILTEVFAHQPDLLEGIERVLRGETARWSFPAKGLYFSTTCLPMRDDAGNVVGGIGVAMDVTEQRAVEDEARSQAERFRRLLSVTSQSGPFEPLATDVLAEVADLLDLEIGLLANVEDGVYTCLASYNREGDPLPTGHAMPLGDTYCDLAVVADGPVLIEHMAESHHREHRCYQINGLEAYVGAPVRVSGQLVGAISFSSTTPSARAFTEADRLLLQLAADWAGA
ncbi:MAG: GAF domain-containing protein, partial [Bacteroidota bacterium]